MRLRTSSVLDRDNGGSSMSDERLPIPSREIEYLPLNLDDSQLVNERAGSDDGGHYALLRYDDDDRMC